MNIFTDKDELAVYKAGCIGFGAMVFGSGLLGVATMLVELVG